ncbi:hypothetical protein BC826DRAFT_286523 [Russula brevipes]|nr:hypothetical protein BC826DRAFT_286523 [Russula brevipes]
MPCHPLFGTVHSKNTTGTPANESMKGHERTTYTTYTLLKGNIAGQCCCSRQLPSQLHRTVGAVRTLCPLLSAHQMVITHYAADWSKMSWRAQYCVGRGVVERTRFVRSSPASSTGQGLHLFALFLRIGSTRHARPRHIWIRDCLARIPVDEPFYC